jgi:hypothetical protein
MPMSRLSSRVVGAVAATAVALGIIAASAPDASANNATMQINNFSGFTLTLKSKRVVQPDHARITMAQDTILPGFAGTFATANSDWPYVPDPDLIYSIGDTGKTIRLYAFQGSPIPTIDNGCEFPDGQPAGIRCVTGAGFGIDYTSVFQVGR